MDVTPSAPATLATTRWAPGAIPVRAGSSWPVPTMRPAIAVPWPWPSLRVPSPERSMPPATCPWRSATAATPVSMRATPTPSPVRPWECMAVAPVTSR